MGLKKLAAGAWGGIGRLCRWAVGTESSSSTANPDASPSPKAPEPASASIYGHEPKQVMRVIGPDGQPFQGPNGEDWSSSKAAVAYVSRHGLLGQGVICPVCSATAAKAGEWQKICRTAWGEAVNCTSCHRMLMAAPDDDIDPVKPGEQYDESIYHKFARPNGFVKTRQRTVTDVPELGDRVLIEDTTGGDGSFLQGKALTGTEATVIADCGSEWRVALNANTGIAGSDIGGTFANIPKSCAFKIADLALRPGDKVRILPRPKDKIEGEAVFDSYDPQHGEVTVTFPDGTTRSELAVERAEKLIANERPIAIIKPTTSTPQSSKE